MLYHDLQDNSKQRQKLKSTRCNTCWQGSLDKVVVYKWDKRKQTYSHKICWGRQHQAAQVYNQSKQIPF